MSTLIIIPTYLEVENIRDVITRVRECVPAADILVVDDNSPDGTAAAAKDAAAELGHIEVLVRPDKGGLGVAYRAGFAHALGHGYDAVVQMDADFSHDPAVLPELLGKLDAGADMVIGSRYVPGGMTHWTRARSILSRVGNRYATTVLGLPVRDATAGFRAYRTDLLRVLQARSTKATGYGFQVELAYVAHRLGANIVEVPITFNDRVRGTSKMSKRIIGEAASLVTWWGVRDRLLGRGWRPDVEEATGTPAPVTSPSDR